jgi:hypothetical protein
MKHSGKPLDRIKPGRDLEEQAEINRQLRGLIAQLDHDLDLLFNSLTWRAGVALANVARTLVFWVHPSQRAGHMGPAHFKGLIRSCPAVREGGAEGASTPAKGEYATGDVETVLNRLWDSLRKESEHGRGP